MYKRQLLDTARPDSGASKVGANYGTIFGVRMGVKQRGYQDYLSFDRNSFVEELSTCSVFFVEALREGGVRLVTPMVQADAENNGDSKRAADIKVLDSITRRSIIELAGALNIPVEIRDIEYHEISGFAGAFSVGTAAGLTRISRIDVKDSAEGRVCHVADYDQLEDSPAKSVINTLYDVLMRARVTELDQALHERFLSWVTKVSAE